MLTKNPLKEALELAFGANLLENIALEGAEIAEKEITLDANNATKLHDIFTLTGSVEILGVWGVVTDATALSNCTNVSLQLNDGTNTIQLSNATGANLSGGVVGSQLSKVGDATPGLSVALADQCRVIDTTSANPIKKFIAIAKATATTIIRMQYTTSLTPINAKIKWYALYKARSTSGGITLA